MPARPSDTARQLEPVTVTASDVPHLVARLRDALSGAGPALLPWPAGSPVPPPIPLPTASDGAPWDDPDDPTALAVPTSGSGGARKIALLPSSALLASASATHDRLGGPGRWLLALPVEHVAGLQVLVRSLVAGTRPVVLDLAGGFDPARFARAAAEVVGVRRYTSLVPTQVTRLLDAGGEATTALAGFDAVLVGGATTPPTLAGRARAAGVRLVLTYGMTETCGGCVYDGVPLDGVDVGLGPDGRIRLGGAVLARGYLQGTQGGPARHAAGRPAGHAAGHADADAAFSRRDGRRWFRTDDLGTWDGDRLTVIGRADDVIITGGLNVAPGPVEDALLRLPGVAEAAVVGVPDAEWGHRVAAALVLAPGVPAPTLEAVRAHVTSAVSPQAAPRQVTVLRALPTRGPGKPDRASLAALMAREG